MNDLLWGACVLMFLSALLIWPGWWIAKRCRTRTVILSVLAAMSLMGAYVWFLYGRLMLAAILPLSSLPVSGNWFPLGTGFLAGIVLGSEKIHVFRRAVFSLALFGIGVFAVVRPLWPAPTPPGGDNWSGDVCLQSNQASCSACAAATLLRHYGIASNEREMMELCLTRNSGTTSLGLYRGLKLKTRGTDLRVDVIHSNVDELLEDDRWPVLLLVKLEPGADVDPRYERDWGWTPGVGHAVVVFGRIGTDRLEVGDPSVGREQWRVRDLRVLWQGRGLGLSPVGR